MIDKIFDIFCVCAKLRTQRHWNLSIFNRENNISTDYIIEYLTIFNFCVYFKVAKEFGRWFKGDFLEIIVFKLMLKLLPAVNINI